MAGSVFFSSVRLSRLQARSILDGAFNEAQKTVTQPLTVVVLDGGGHFIPVAGGVLVLDEDQHVIGAVGVSGASSAEDEHVAIAGIEAAGLSVGLEPD